jgi:hypothetical protein
MKSTDVLMFLFGAIGFTAILKWLNEQKTSQMTTTFQCPSCRNQIRLGVSHCPYCYTNFRWRRRIDDFIN